MITLDPILVVGAAVILFLVGYLCGGHDEHVKEKKMRESIRALRTLEVIEF